MYFKDKDIYIKLNSTTDMTFMLGLWNFALTDIVKHDHKICDKDNKFALTENGDKHKFWKNNNSLQELYSLIFDNLL